MGSSASHRGCWTFPPRPWGVPAEQREGCGPPVETRPSGVCAVRVLPRPPAGRRPGRRARPALRGPALVPAVPVARLRVLGVAPWSNARFPNRISGAHGCWHISPVNVHADLFPFLCGVVCLSVEWKEFFVYSGYKFLVFCKKKYIYALHLFSPSPWLVFSFFRRCLSKRAWKHSFDDVKCIVFILFPSPTMLYLINLCKPWPVWLSG